MDKDDEAIDLSAIVSTIHEHIDTRLVEDGLAEGTILEDATVDLRLEAPVDSQLKCVRVVAALIIEDGRVLATQRNYGEFEGGWEFPGGKIEPGETSQQALCREIEEELELEIDGLEFFDKALYDYPTFHLDMDCFTCHIKSGTLTLHDHSQLRWLNAKHVEDVEWLPADLPIAEKLKPLLFG